MASQRPAQRGSHAGNSTAACTGTSAFWAAFADAREHLNAEVARLPAVREALRRASAELDAMHPLTPVTQRARLRRHIARLRHFEQDVAGGAAMARFTERMTPYLRALSTTAWTSSWAAFLSRETTPAHGTTSPTAAVATHADAATDAEDVIISQPGRIEAAARAAAAAAAPPPASSPTPATPSHSDVPPSVFVEDTCPVCAAASPPRRVVLVMDAVEPVLLCPRPTCTYHRPYQNLRCTALTHEDRTVGASTSVKAAADLFQVMQAICFEERQTVPATVIAQVEAELRRRAGSAAADGDTCSAWPPSYDDVEAAMSTLKHAKWYNYRVQIRARITGITPVKFTTRQKVTLMTLHGILNHMQPWADPARNAQNLHMRLLALCHMMGWWAFLPALRMQSGSEARAKFDTVQRVVHTALGWPWTPVVNIAWCRNLATTVLQHAERPDVSPPT